MPENKQTVRLTSRIRHAHLCLSKRLTWALLTASAMGLAKYWLCRNYRLGEASKLFYQRCFESSILERFLSLDIHLKCSSRITALDFFPWKKYAKRRSVARSAKSSMANVAKDSMTQAVKDSTTKAVKGSIVSNAKSVLSEILWPTRCAVCDIAGNKVLCDECESRLKFIDAYTACPICGAPYGVNQCTECNTLMLKSSGLESFPFEFMSHAIILNDEAKRIVSSYKDQNERRLRKFIASVICRYIPPRIIESKYILTYIPDSKKAYKRRGFDHSFEIAYEVSKFSGLSIRTLLQRPVNIDQRKLTRIERIKNMSNSMAIMPNVTVPKNIVLIDDVCTTGATIYSACLALKRAGAKNVCAVTFGQVLA